MNTEPLNPENALAVQHQAWLNHPCTKQMFQVLDKQKEFYTQRAIGFAWVFPDQDEGTIRNTVAASVVQTTIKVLKETDQFLAKLVS